MKRLMTIAVALLGMSADADAQWMQMQGPEGGNASAIAHVDGATIAVMRPDALYRLADGSTRWTRIGDLEADELHVVGNAVIATTPDGLRRSTDAGTTWTRVGPEGMPIVRSVDGTRAYATSLGLYRSVDSGATWSPIDGNIRTIIEGEYTPVAIAGAGDTIVVGEPFTRGVLRSTDDGATWTQVVTGLPDSANASVLAQIGGVFYAQMNNEIAGRQDGVFRSLDGGLTWSPLSEGLPQFGERTGYVFAFFTEGSFVSASTVLGLYHLEDTTWVGSSAEIVVGTAADAAGNLYRATFDGIRVSDDGGVTWGRLDRGLLSQNIAAMTAFGNRVIASASSGIHTSTDRGLTWQPASPERIEEFVTIDGVIVGRGAEYSNVGLVRSTDGGQSWMPAGLGIDRAQTGTTALAAGDGVLYVAFHDPVTEPTSPPVRRGGLYRSIDAGASWSLVRNGLPLVDDSTVAVLQVAASGDTAIVQTFHGFYRTTDAGETWTPAATGLGAASSIRLLEAHAGSFYATIGTHVWASDDGGATFRLSGQPDNGRTGPVERLVTLNQALVAITSDRGTTKLSMFANNEWQPFLTMPDRIRGRVAVLAEGRLYVGTESHGIYRIDFEPAGVARDDDAAAIAWTPHPLRTTGSTVALTIDRTTDVSLELVDVTGRRVASTGAIRLAAGRHRIDAPVAELTPGAYAYRLTIGSERHSGVVVVAE